MKEILSDRNESKLIERINALRESHPDLKVGEIKRPLVIGGVADGVYQAEVQY